MTSCALLFPGQGSQEAGMGRELAEARPEAMTLWKRAEAISGLPLREIYWEGDAAAMSDTRALQPALTVVNINLWRELAGKVRPCAAAGHSLGEFSALAAAEVLDPETVLQIVSLRGRLMAEADPDGTGSMAAILKMKQEDVEALAREAAVEADALLIVANYNTPAQFVVSGHRDAVALACQKAKEHRGRAIELKVSGAFHSPLMLPAQQQLEEAIAKTTFHTPKCPVYQNVDALPHTEPEEIKQNLIKQLTASVLWTKEVQNMLAAGATEFTECGPGKTLQGMIAKIAKGVAEVTLKGVGE